jgi:predicted transposase/invertase (TIGR01784 family)
MMVGGTMVYAYSDIFVRYLLGDEGNKDLLISFINAVNEDSGFPAITEINIKNPINIRTMVLDKESVIDIKAWDENGRQYDIEIQIAGDSDFSRRSLYYWAKLYGSQLDQGEDYSDLKPTICINLLGFKLFEQGHIGVHSCFVPKELVSNDVLSDHLVIHFIELPKFQKRSGFTSLFEHWLGYFKYAGQQEDVMRTLLESEPKLEKAHTLYKRFTQNDEMIELYEARMKYKRDHATLLRSAEKRGLEEGEKRGLEEGQKRGLEKGRRENREEIARTMLTKGMEVATIVEITQLSIQQIEQLRRKADIGSRTDIDRPEGSDDT